MKNLMLAALFLIPTVCNADYFSQKGQDKFIHHNYFEGYVEGVFVDIGACDGVTNNHTCFFERDLGWSGLCVEPIPNAFTELKYNRICACVLGCVANRKGEGQFLKISRPGLNTEMLLGLIDKYEDRHVKRIKREISRFGGSCELIDVKCHLINDLLEQNGINHINLLSVEAEGGEFDILATLDFSHYKTDVILVGDRYRDKRFIPFLETKGFNYVQRLHQNLIFVREDFKPSTRLKY